MGIKRRPHGAIGATILLALTLAVASDQRSAAPRGEIVYPDRTYSEAARVLHSLAEQGDVASQYTLGYLYDSGVGVPRDHALAAEWYLKAARGGHAEAQNGIAVMYLFGRGVEKNIGKAADWFRQASEQGNATAQANLGDMYFEGVGVPKDWRKAAHWYRRASDQGDAHGHLNLGWMYYAGLGVPQRNYIEAYKLTRLAAAGGEAGAEDNLALIAQRLTPREILRADRLARIWSAKDER